MPRIEYLSHDILDENFVKSFSTIHTAQMLLGCARVDIRDGFVTPPSKAQKIYSFIWICITFITMYLVLTFYYDLYYGTNIILCLTFTGGFMWQYLTYVVNMIQSRFYNGQQHVQLYLMLQKVDHHFRTLTDFKIVHNNQFLFNFFAVILIVFFYACGFSYYIVNTDSVPKFTLVLCGAFLTFHIDLLLTVALIYFLGVRLRILNKIIEVDGFYDTGNKVLGFRNFPTLNENDRMSRIGESKNLMGLEDIKACLWKILKGYSFIAEIFQLQVFTLVSAAFCYIIMAIEIFVIGLRTQIVPVPVMFAIGGWLYLFSLQVVMLVMVNYWFAIKVDTTKAICVHALSLVYEGPVYKIAKGTVKLIETDQPVFNVYGVFELNNTLPLTMLGILTSNIVILLQFTM